MQGLLLFALAICQRPDAESPRALYREAYASYRHERYSEALENTTLGLRATNTAADAYWKFRLLKAQILLGKREAGSAVDALQFDFPARFRTPQNLSRYWLCMGFAANLLHDNDSARLRLKDAALLAQSAGDQELFAEIQNRLGLVATEQRQYDEAEALFKKARIYATGKSVPWLNISATSNLGFRLLRLRKYEEAIPFFEQSARAAREFKAVEGEARSNGNLGFCLYQIGDLDRALGRLQLAEARFKITGNRLERGRWLGILGNIHLGRSEYPVAAVYYKDALAIARALGAQGEEDAASWLTNLARISIDTGETDAAEKYNNEALAIKRRLNLAEGYSTINAARIASDRGDFSRSEAIAREILRSPSEDPTRRLQAHERLAIDLATTKQFVEAEAEFRAAMSEIESRRNQLLKYAAKLAYFSSLVGFYQYFIDFLMDRGKTDEALEVADSSRAATMTQRLRGTQPHAASSTRTADYRKLSALSRSTILSYSLGVVKSHLWVVTPDSVTPFEMPAQSEIVPLIEAYDKSIQDLQNPLIQRNEAGEKLYQILVAPASGPIRATGRAILIPDGQLYSLNFDTLPVPGATPHYLIDDATISIAPSLGLLTTQTGSLSPPAKSLLLVGNPVSPDPEFPDLVFAADEIGRIKASLPAYRKTVLEGQRARPDAWEKARPQDFGLMHFAAHATANAEEPLESAVILSRGSSGSYRLTARDIVNTPLTAQLVTISACRSAGSRIYAGEGLVGLAWAFLESGAHNVIAGLWDVNDESSPRTMSKLYGGLAAGRGPADALREAKLELLHSKGVYRKPWYWGSFQLFTTDARN